MCRMLINVLIFFTTQQSVFRLTLIAMFVLCHNRVAVLLPFCARILTIERFIISMSLLYWLNKG